MKYISLFFSALLLFTFKVSAIPWPSITGSKIESCTDVNTDLPGGACNYNVVVTNTGTVFSDIQPVGKPDLPLVPNPPEGSYFYEQNVNIVAWGLICRKGSKIDKIPYRDCKFLPSDDLTRDAPKMAGKCRLISNQSWELTPDSDCSVEPFYKTAYSYSDFKSGGECAVFAQNQVEGNTRALNTPFGILNPDLVANGYGSFCAKVLPFDQVCDIDFPPVIDHGIVPPNGNFVASVTGSVNCGKNPVINIIGGNELLIAPGVKTKLDINLQNNSATLTSNLTLNNAQAGQYLGNLIVVATPL